MEFVKAFQELNNAYDALVTYDDYNDDMETSSEMREQVKTLEDYIGVYNTVKGSLIEEEGDEGEPDPDFSEIEFYSDNTTKLYDIDSTYIDKLLEGYIANSQDTREEIEKALQKMNKPEPVREVYTRILNSIDSGQIDPSDDIFAVKRQYFTDASNQAIESLSSNWFVNEDELHLSAIQYVPGSETIPNITGILGSKQFDKYKQVHPDAKPLKYGPQMKREWLHVLNEEIVPYGEELR